MSGPVIEAQLKAKLTVGSEFDTRDAAQCAAELLCNEQRTTRATTRQETSKPLRCVVVCITTYEKKKAAEQARARLRQLERTEPPSSALLQSAQTAVNNAEAECGSLCPFRASFTRTSLDKPYRCNRLHSEHSCLVLSQPKRHALSRASNMDQIVSALHTGPDRVHKPKALADTVRRHLHYIPPVHTTQRARHRVRKARLGDHNTQWQQLRHYIELLKEADPAGLAEKEGFNVIVSPSTAPETARLCKPVVAVDGCHAQGQLKLTILLACALDGDNHLNVLAWGLCEAESEASWTWFLSRLKSHIPVLNDPNRVLVSDRQKGLLNAVERELPATKQSYCCQHLISNVRRHYNNEAAAFFQRLVNVRSKEGFMQLLEANQPNFPGQFFRYITLLGPFESWARAWFGFPGRFGTTTSNTVEASNAWIGELREKPVVDMLHGLRDKVLRHAVKQKRAAQAYKGPVTPRALPIVQEELQRAHWYLGDALLWSAAPSIIGRVTGPNSGDRQVRVYAINDDGSEAEGASVEDQSRPLACECPCGFYEEYRILCRHALALLILAELDRPSAERLVAPFYTTKGWQAVYERLMPLHCLPKELEVDEDEPLPKARGNGKGNKKRKRHLPGQAPSQASQVERDQN